MAVKERVQGGMAGYQVRTVPWVLRNIVVERHEKQ